MTEAPAGRWRAFAVIAVAVFMSVLDLFIVNVAFTDIRRDFPDNALSELSWILTAYAITFAALLVPMGKLGDLYGRKRVFQIGLLTFVAASALCAAAPSAEFLIAARALQGVGAAAITPTSLGLILPLFPPGERATAIGAWAGLAGVGAAMGPPLGGLLVEASWRWIFLINIPLGLVTVLRVGRRLGEFRDSEARLPDGLGTALGAASIALLTVGLAQGPDWDWDGRALGSFAGAVITGGAFVARSLRHPAPALELGLFRAPAFALANAATFLFFAGFGAFLLGSVLFLTQVWGYSVLEAGFAVAPGPGMAALAAPISGRLGDRLGPAALGAPGGLLFAGGTAWFLALGPEPNYVVDYLPGLLIGGTGVGLVLPSLTAAALMSLPPQRIATGIGVETTFRQIGAALGVAAWVALVGSPSQADALNAFDRGFAYMVACTAAAGLTLLGLALTSGRRSAELPAAAGPTT